MLRPTKGTWLYAMQQVGSDVHVFLRTMSRGGGSGERWWREEDGEVKGAEWRWNFRY